MVSREWKGKDLYEQIVYKQLMFGRAYQISLCSIRAIHYVLLPNLKQELSTPFLLECNELHCIQIVVAT
jgi:hypothetical protein